MKKLLTLCLLASIGWAPAQTTIVIDGFLRNGDFDDDPPGVDKISFADTNFWDSLGTS